MTVYISKLDKKLKDRQAKRIIRWVKDLESDKFPQCRNSLQEWDEDGKPVGYCCLGVAAIQIDGPKPRSFDDNSMYPVPDVSERFGWEPKDDGEEDGGCDWILYIPDELWDRQPDHRKRVMGDRAPMASATSLNDSYLFSFREIAQCVRYTYAELFS